MKISETTPTTPAGEMCDTCGIDGVAACSWEQCPRRAPSAAPAEAGRVSEDADASLMDVLDLLEKYRDGRQRLLDSPYEDYTETRPEAERQLKLLNRAMELLRRDKFLNTALGLLGMAATRERTGFSLPGDWITQAHKALGLPEYNPTKTTVGDPHKLISRLYEFHHWVCRSPDHGEFKSLVGTLQSTIQRLRAQPGPANNREPPHCSTCECGMERPANAEVDARDAARYRWLRSDASGINDISKRAVISNLGAAAITLLEGAELDTAIDAAMSASAASEGE